MAVKKSKIIGRAIIQFGGSIMLGIGYDENTKRAALSFSETKKEHKLGEELTEGEETYGGQVQFEFDNLKSLEILRDAIDACEYVLKYGEIPDTRR